MKPIKQFSGKLLTALSAAALLSATPAFAQTNNTANNPDTPDVSTVTEKDIERGVDRTGDAIKQGYKNVKAAVIGTDTSVKRDPVVIDTRMTAEGIIGKPVFDASNRRIATVEDIILDSSGNASLIVVKDGGFLGMGGKLAAFDYASVIQRTTDGDVIMPVTKETLDNVAEFSYTPRSGEDNVRVIPQNGTSVAQMLKGKLLDNDGRTVADIDNLAFRNGRADLVIAAYGKVLNMGGENVAVSFDTKQVVSNREDETVNIRLSANQAQAIKNIEAKR